MGSRAIRITHRSTGSLIAEGPIGWGITPFDGAFYIRRKYLKTTGFRPNFIPGICPYKFFYVWMDLKLEDDRKVSSLGWLYWLPNPLLPFICFRVAVPSHHPELNVEEIGEPAVSTSRSQPGWCNRLAVSRVQRPGQQGYGLRSMLRLLRANLSKSHPAVKGK